MRSDESTSGMIRRHRLLAWLGGAALVLVVAAAGVVWYFVRSDRETPVRVEDAVAAFQGVPGSLGSPDPNARPGDPGVYSYATVGYEEVDALGGARHDYPAETYITLRPGGCGTTIRWDALVERWEEQNLCAGPRLAGLVSFHRWFGVDDRGTWSCPEPGSLIGGDAFECTTGESVEEYRAELVGMERVLVAGEPFDAIHVRIETTATGRTSGSGSSDTWWLPGTDLILRRTWVDNSLTASPLGDIRYFEKVELTLASPVPVG